MKDGKQTDIRTVSKARYMTRADWEKFKAANWFKHSRLSKSCGSAPHYDALRFCKRTEVEERLTARNAEVRQELQRSLGENQRLQAESAQRQVGGPTSEQPSLV